MIRNVLKFIGLMEKMAQNISMRRSRIEVTDYRYVLLVIPLAFVCIVVVIMLYWLLFFPTCDAILQDSRWFFARMFYCTSVCLSCSLFATMVPSLHLQLLDCRLLFASLVICRCVLLKVCKTLTPYQLLMLTCVMLF